MGEKVTDVLNSREPRDPPRFYSVPATARMLGVSPMTLYRSIAEHQFPAIRIRNRLIIPAQYVEDMVHTAVTTTATVEAADWATPTTRPGPPSQP